MRRSNGPRLQHPGCWGSRPPIPKPVQPKTQYTKSGDVNVAFQVFGEGQFDLVFVYGFVSHLDSQLTSWTGPVIASYLRFG
jgi:hypothetical protein